MSGAVPSRVAGTDACSALVLWSGKTTDVLRSREEVDAFEEKEGVATTPQVFIDGERIGGSDDLERYLAA